jgi:U3 small nucleolar RNA-associated protein 20
MDAQGVSQENDSHFHQALEHWRQLNLAGSFIQFANEADPLSGSMALLLHHWKDVIGLWSDAMKVSDDEGLLALLEYVTFGSTRGVANEQ